MRVLLSAYSCGPRSGSQVGVGWDWALEVACLGHDVVTLTEIAYRGDIETKNTANPLPANRRFEFFMPIWRHALRRFGWRLGLHSLAEHVSHLGWQVLAYRYARRRFADERFDLVHHITYGGIRHPT